MIKQIRFTKQDAVKPGQSVVDVAAFDDDGNPVEISGRKQGTPVADAAGDAPTKAEFDLLLNSLRGANIIAVE